MKRRKMRQGREKEDRNSGERSFLKMAMKQQQTGLMEVQTVAQGTGEAAPHGEDRLQCGVIRM